MPSKNEPKQPRIGVLRRLANLVQGNMDDMYRNTYYADPSNRQSLQDIKTDISNINLFAIIFEYLYNIITSCNYPYMMSG